MQWVSIKDKLPPKPGKYVIITESISNHVTIKYRNTNRFEARFNGKNFDINNQVATHWLDEELSIKKILIILRTFLLFKFPILKTILNFKLINEKI